MNQMVSLLQMVMGVERKSWLSETLDLGSVSTQLPHGSWTMKDSLPWLSSTYFLSSWPLPPSPALSGLLISLLSLFFPTPSRGEKYSSSPGKAALSQHCYFFFSQWHLLYFWYYCFKAPCRTFLMGLGFLETQKPDKLSLFWKSSFTEAMNHKDYLLKWRGKQEGWK